MEAFTGGEFSRIKVYPKGRSGDLFLLTSVRTLMFTWSVEAGCRTRLLATPLSHNFQLRKGWVTNSSAQTTVFESADPLDLLFASGSARGWARPSTKPPCRCRLRPARLHSENSDFRKRFEPDMNPTADQFVPHPGRSRCSQQSRDVRMELLCCTHSHGPTRSTRPHIHHQ